jgi:hypothetical protein
MELMSDVVRLLLNSFFILLGLLLRKSVLSARLEGLNAKEQDLIGKWKEETSKAITIGIAMFAVLLAFNLMHVIGWLTLAVGLAALCTIPIMAIPCVVVWRRSLRLEKQLGIHVAKGVWTRIRSGQS